MVVLYSSVGRTLFLRLWPEFTNQLGLVGVEREYCFNKWGQGEVSGSDATAGLELVDLTIQYPDTSKPAVDRLNLVVAPGELVCLLGPSGCGKTTILKAVAGLLKPAWGHIRMNGQSLAAVPTEKRSIGMVFQKPLLFPHLNVGANIAFGLKMRRVDPGLIKSRVQEMLKLVQMEGMEERGITEISGGQAQRVALGRALIIEPQVWLLDEPLSQLDANLREEMGDLIRSIQRQMGITTLFVTHDQEEAVVLADRIGLVLEGRLKQIGPPPDLLETPASVEVARFFGGHNQIRGVVDEEGFRCELGTFRLACPGFGGPGVLVIRQEAVEEGAGENSFWARVERARYRGTHQEVEMTAAGNSVVMNIPSNRVYPAGQRVRIRFPRDRIWVVPG